MRMHKYPDSSPTPTIIVKQVSCKGRVAIRNRVLWVWRLLMHGAWCVITRIRLGFWFLVCSRTMLTSPLSHSRSRWWAILCSCMFHPLIGRKSLILAVTISSTSLGISYHSMHPRTVTSSCGMSCLPRLSRITLFESISSRCSFSTTFNPSSNVGQ